MVFGLLASNIRSFVRSLSVILNGVFKLQEQVCIVVRTAIYGLRILAKTKAYLPQKDRESNPCL